MPSPFRHLNLLSLCHHCSRKKVNDEQPNTTALVRHTAVTDTPLLQVGIVFLSSIQTATRSDRQKAQGTCYCSISRENPRSNSVCSRSVKQMHSPTWNTARTLSYTQVHLKHRHSPGLQEIQDKARPCQHLSPRGQLQKNPKSCNLTKFYLMCSPTAVKYKVPQPGCAGKLSHFTFSPQRSHSITCLDLGHILQLRRGSSTLV